MKTVDAKGQRLDTMLFIEVYRLCRKTAPARFMTLRLHPDRYKELEKCAEPPECVEMGLTPGPLGRSVMRVICVKPPLGISDGIAIVQDANADPSKLIFDVHGIPEVSLENLAL